MCGIFGSTKIYSEDIIGKKLTRMNFRGPDHTGYKVLNNKILLGHNRLSILDLDPRANQPLQYGHLHIVFNGEIYNYLEIRNELNRKGYSFHTSSDTEVLCAAYLAYGVKCMDHFNGMFAFVIYDENNNNLFGARDRLGKKPFYYTLADNYFEFASQLSVIAINNSFNISEVAVDKFLLRGYIEDPYSIYTEVSKLEAGFAFTYNLKTRFFNKFQYWDIDLRSPESPERYEDAKVRLKFLLQDAVKIRMISDVNLGTFLSGGIDSSLVTAMAQEQAFGRINSFSIKFFNEQLDESGFASDVAKHLGVNHTIIPCDYAEGLKIIEEINYYFDEPFADSSAVPTMLLARYTKKYITVALSGDGGDEVFMGYKRYKWFRDVKPIFTLPDSVRKLVGKMLLKFPNYRHKAIGKFLLKKNIDTLINDALITYYPEIFLTIPQSSHNYEYVLTNHGNSIAKRVADLDIKLWLCNDGLVKVDRAAMAASMEVRCPLLDYRVVEFGRALPVKYRFKGVNQKLILKDILYEYIPKTIVDRPKAGFTTPFKEWFRHELKEYVYDVLNEQNLKLVHNLNIPFIKNSIDRHMEGAINFYPEIWKLIVLINWLKNRNAR